MPPLVRADSRRPSAGPELIRLANIGAILIDRAD